MNPELWKKVDALLEEALAQPPDQREAFVTEASKDNTALRDEVLSLLKAQAKASNFMERSAMRVAAAALAQDSNLTTSFSLVGKEVASYKIERLLGAGGMGEVYLARDSKLDRQVALKIGRNEYAKYSRRLKSGLEASAFRVTASSFTLPCRHPKATSGCWI